MALVVGLAASCAESQHATDDEDVASGGTRSDGGEGAEPAGSGGDEPGGGRGGATSGGGAGRTGSGTAGDSAGDAGRAGTTGGDAGRGGDSASGGDGTSATAGSGGIVGVGGAGGNGPRPPFSPKVACDPPRWLTTVVQPLEATDPLAVTNGLGLFMVTTMTSEDVNTFETWGNAVVTMSRSGLYPNLLENTVGQGSHPRLGQLAMGRTGDALWSQNPGILDANEPTLRRWDQTRGTWDAPHVVSGMRGASMRAAFLDEHDILVIGAIEDDVVSTVYDHESLSWSEPEPIGKLLTGKSNWGLTHFALASDGAGNAAAAWSKDEMGSARVMREGTWQGDAVSIPVDSMIQGFWDLTVVSAGGGDFELVAGPQDQTRGVMMKAWSLDYAADTGTVLGNPADVATVPVVNAIGGQPIAVVRDVDGELTAGSLFWSDRPAYWVFRRTDGVWSEPALLADGIIAANVDIGWGIRTLALDSGGHALAITADGTDQLVLRELEKGGSTWTAGIRIDTEEFRFNRRGASLVLDADEPVIFWSAQGSDGGNVAWTACRFSPAGG
jgi:hypothetical protein